MQRLGFLEWYKIAAKNPYRFFELPFGIVVFPFSRRDHSLGPLNFAGQPTPVLSISKFLAATSEERVRSLGVANLRIYFGK
jgi:hypothetical protein